jgi:hypothetical protein
LGRYGDWNLEMYMAIIELESPSGHHAPSVESWPTWSTLQIRSRPCRKCSCINNLQIQPNWAPQKHFMEHPRNAERLNEGLREPPAPDPCCGTLGMFLLLMIFSRNLDIFLHKTSRSKSRARSRRRDRSFAHPTKYWYFLY